MEVEMKIRVLGRGCAKCNLTYDLVQKVVCQTGVCASLEKINSLKEMAKYGVFVTPAVVIDDTVRSAGKIPTEEEITAWISPLKD